MSGNQQELEFDPKTMTVDSDADEDLGEYNSYVEKMEAEANAAETEDEEVTAEADDGQTESEDTEASAEETEEAETEEVSEDETAELEETTEEEIVAEDELADPNENPLIPRERLNQANRKRQEEAERANKLEYELAQMKAQMAAAAEDVGVQNIDASVLKEAAEKALDGDTEAFSNMLSDQMSTLTDNMTKQQERMYEKARQDAVAEIRSEQMARERQEAASVWEEIYPSLDPNSEHLNEEALTEAIDLMGVYEQKGYSPTAAMERAVNSVAVNFELEPSQETTVTPAKPVQKKVVPKRAAKPEVKQPPATGQGGADKTKSPGIDPMSMSQDEWNSLPESVREEYLTGG